MTAKELIHKLEQKYPPEKAESWDNSGLQCGRKNKEVAKIYLALDATEEIIDAAAESGTDLLITHHPLMLGGIKSVTSDTMTGRKLLKLIHHDMCHYAIHTNYDVVEMGLAAGELMKLQKQEVLEITGNDPATGEPEGIGRVGSLVRPVTIEECCRIVKQLFHLDTVKVFGDPDQVIERVAICPGSGKSVIPAAIRAKAQVLITGDIGHHDGLDAVDQGLAIIDAGHYGIEHIFIGRMERLLKQQTTGIEIRTAPIRNPFRVL